MSQTTGNKVLVWSLGALTSLSSYIALISKNQVNDLKLGRESERKYYQQEMDKRDRIITIERDKKDSLQGVIVNRSDRSYDELKAILNIEDRRNTIIIKPKTP